MPITTKIALIAILTLASSSAFAKCYQAALPQNLATGIEGSDFKVTLRWSGSIDDSGMIGVTSESTSKTVKAEFGAIRPPNYPSAHISIRCVLGDKSGDFTAVMNKSTVAKIQPHGQFQIEHNDDSNSGTLAISKGLTSDLEIMAVDDSVCQKVFYSKRTQASDGAKPAAVLPTTTTASEPSN